MKEKKQVTFEDNLNLLEGLVTELEQGDIDLDKAIDTYTKAMKVAKDCNNKLNEATESVNKVLKEDGTLQDFKVVEGE